MANGELAADTIDVGQINDSLVRGAVAEATHCLIVGDWVGFKTAAALALTINHQPANTPEADVLDYFDIKV